MNLTNVLVEILGIIFLVIGVSMIFNKKGTKAAVEKITQDDGVLWLAGFSALVMGAVIVALNNVWTSGWTLVITVMGWLCLIKGFFILVFPNPTTSLYKKFNKDVFFVIVGLIAIIIGLIFLL